MEPIGPVVSHAARQHASSETDQLHGGWAVLAPPGTPRVLVSNTCSHHIARVGQLEGRLLTVGELAVDPGPTSSRSYFLDCGGTRLPSDGLQNQSALSEVELLFTPRGADRVGAVADRLDCGWIGGDVGVKVDELKVTAGVGVDGVKDGLEQVGH